MSNPSDYYKEKEEEARRLRQEIAELQLRIKDWEGDIATARRTIQKLQRQLERAEYTGD